MVVHEAAHVLGAPHLAALLQPGLQGLPCISPGALQQRLNVLA